MLDSVLRKPKDRVLHPITVALAGRVSATAITLTGLAIGVLAAVLIAFDIRVGGLVLWLLNRFLDGLDGAVSRLDGTQSDFGGYLDLMCDVVVYAGVAISLAVGGGVETWVAAAIMLSAFYINITSWSLISAITEKRRAEGSGGPTTVKIHRGLLEGTETIVVYSLLILLPEARFTLMLAASAAAFYSIAERIVLARRVL